MSEQQQPFSMATKETSQELIEDKGKIVPNVKNMPKGAFKPNKGSK